LLRTPLLCVAAGLTGLTLREKGGRGGERGEQELEWDGKNKNGEGGQSNYENGMGELQEGGRAMVATDGVGKGKGWVGKKGAKIGMGKGGEGGREHISVMVYYTYTFNLKQEVPSHPDSSSSSESSP